MEAEGKCGGAFINIYIKMRFYNSSRRMRKKNYLGTPVTRYLEALERASKKG